MKSEVPVAQRPWQASRKEKAYGKTGKIPELPTRMTRHAFKFLIQRLNLIEVFD